LASPTPLSLQRLLNQQLSRPRFITAAELVRWFGAVQAQDYLGALWALGLRMTGATEGDIEDAIAARTIVRTWPMRGTLHFVPAEDSRWMLRLLAPRVIARSGSRYRELGLDAAVFTRARRLLVRALQGGRRLARHDAYAAIERGGVSAEGQRGIHILGHLAQQGLICHGPRHGRQPTFVLLDEWVPAAKDLPRDQALPTLATRYFASHGPATVQDFAWWSGLPAREAQAAIDAAGPSIRKAARAARSRATTAVLLPPWDEYVVAYKDRAGALGHLRGDEAGAGMAIGKSLIVIDGRVRGSWKRELGASTVRLSLGFWTAVSAAERAAVHKAAQRYARFLGRTLL